jgi:hypothetical protein
MVRNRTFRAVTQGAEPPWVYTRSAPLEPPCRGQALRGSQTRAGSAAQMQTLVRRSLPASGSRPSLGGMVVVVRRREYWNWPGRVKGAFWAENSFSSGGREPLGRRTESQFGFRVNRVPLGVGRPEGAVWPQSRDRGKRSAAIPTPGRDSGDPSGRASGQGPSRAARGFETRGSTNPASLLGVTGVPLCGQCEGKFLQ